MKNNVFESLLAGAKTVEQVGSTTGAFVRGLRAIMNALVGFELLAKNGENTRSFNMLVHSEQGDTFSFNEIKSWLEAAGFKNAHTVEAPGPSPLVLATKP